MSDGNYNRNLLPYNNYQSGLKAGRATMRSLAVKAFEKQLSLLCPNFSDDEKEKIIEAFKQDLE